MLGHQRGTKTIAGVILLNWECSESPNEGIHDQFREGGVLGHQGRGIKTIAGVILLN
jgi:hypothetical protein